MKNIFWSSQCINPRFMCTFWRFKRRNLFVGQVNQITCIKRIVILHLMHKILHAFRWRCSDHVFCRFVIRKLAKWFHFMDNQPCIYNLELYIYRRGCMQTLAQYNMFTIAIRQASNGRPETCEKRLQVFSMHLITQNDQKSTVKQWKCVNPGCLEEIDELSRTNWKWIHIFTLGSHQQCQLLAVVFLQKSFNKQKWNVRT